jgi:DNA-binding NarL/FixJ family response regulator
VGGITAPNPVANRWLTNAEITERLVLSVHPVDHHVSAILTKLRVSMSSMLVA